MSDKEQVEHELISTSLDVEQLDTTLFRSKSLWLPKRARGVFGGQVISQALVCATQSVDPSYALHSLHCYFLLSASASIPMIYFVERARHGRSFTTRSVKASQSGKMVFIMLCSFQKPDPLQLSHQIPLPPNIPPPDLCVPQEIKFDELARDTTLHPRLRAFHESNAQDRRWSPIEIRFATDRTDAEGAYVIMWWMRVRRARGMPDRYEQPFQKCILAYLSDQNFIGTVSRTLKMTREKGPRRQVMGGSLDHSIFYYNHDIDCSEWLLYMMTSPVSSNGRGMVIGRIYTQSGTLIATTTQEGLVRIDTKHVQQQEQQKARL